jgi:hypothetical protein
MPDPTVGQVAALAAVFGVEPPYLIDRKEPAPLDGSSSRVCATKRRAR